MNATPLSFIAIAIAFAVILAGAVSAGATVPLGAGPFSTLQMTLERTIFRVDAARVSVRVDRETENRLRELAQGQRYSDPLADRIAGTVFHSAHALVSMRFLRDVSLDEFLSETRKAESCAFEAGMVSPQERDRVLVHLSEWYAPLERRDVKKGDTLVYEMSGNSTETIYRGNDGHVLVHMVAAGWGPRSSVLAGYFANCSQFREDLIRSLFPR